MKVLAATMMMLLIAGCSKDTSNTTIQSASGQNSIQNKTTTVNGEALLDLTDSDSNLSFLLPVGKMPDESSSDYLIIEETDNQDGEKSVDVKGIKIILDYKSRLNIYAQSKLKEMKIEAKEVVVAEDFKIPGAQLSIKAEKLTFINEGKIITTAINNAVIPERTVDGKKGPKGGSIFLDVKSVDLGKDAVRFVMNGGPGQPAGFGIPGSAGKSVESQRGSVLRYCTTTINSCFEREIGSMELSRSFKCTGDNFPTDGGNAVAAGSPGAGGDGGDLFLSEGLTIPQASYEQKAGNIGAIAPVTKGGVAGTPRTVTTEYNTVHNSTGMCSRGGGGGKTSPGSSRNVVVELNGPASGSTADGLDAVSPSTAKESSTNGSLKVFTSSPFSEKYLSLRLNFAKDAYRNFKLTEAENELSEIYSLASLIPAEKKLGQAEKESMLLLAQIRSHKDLDGYALNFAPNLSMSKIVKLYQEEVNRAFNTLKFTSYFKNKIKSVEAKSEKIHDQIDMFNQNIVMDKNQNSLAHENYAAVERSISEVVESQRAFEVSLNEVVAQIENEARRNIHNQEKKKKLLGAVKLIATLAKVSPVGQPAAAAIGSSIESVVALSQKEDVDWKDVVKTSYGAYEDLTEINWEKSREDWNKNYSSLYYDKFKERNPGITKNKFEAYMKNLVKSTQPLYKATADYLENNYRNQVPKSAYDQEVERIKSIHPRFKELTTKLSDLQNKKDKLNSNLILTMSVIRETESNIVKSIQAIAATETEYVNFTDGLDFTVNDALTFYEKSAKETLLKYKIYLVKSYSYRLLKPWKGSMDLEKIEAKLNRFVQTDGDTIDLDILKETYNEDLKLVSKEVFDSLSSGTLKEYISDESFNLNSGELEALKSGKSIVLDLSKKIASRDSEENRRILSIEVEGADVTDNSGAPVDFIFKHSGKSVLTKNMKNYAFIHESANINWVTRVSNGQVSPLAETNIQNSLFALFLSEDNVDESLQEHVGLNSRLTLNLSKFDTISEIRYARIKVTYSFNLK